jgi:hypothetical protein
MTTYRPAAGLPGYRVGDDGSVWKLRKNGEWRQVKASLNGGIAVVDIYRNGSHGTLSVASLVLRSFGVPRPPGHHALHFPDSNKFNNRLCNLRWAPAILSTIGVSKNPPSGEKHKDCKISDRDVFLIREMAQSGEFFYAEIAERFGISTGHVNRIVKGVQRKGAPGQIDSPDTQRIVRGEAVSSSKLTEDDVIRIRELAATGEYSCDEIAELFGVCVQTIYRTVRGEIWKHVPGAIVVGGRRRRLFVRGKLREPDIFEIRRLARMGITQRAIARKFGVSFPTISQIVNRKIWKHLPDLTESSAIQAPSGSKGDT